MDAPGCRARSRASNPARATSGSPLPASRAASLSSAECSAATITPSRATSLEAGTGSTSSDASVSWMSPPPPAQARRSRRLGMQPSRRLCSMAATVRRRVAMIWRSAARLDDQARISEMLRRSPASPPSAGRGGAGRASSASSTSWSLHETSSVTGGTSRGSSSSSALPRTTWRCASWSRCPKARAPRKSASCAARSSRRLCTGVAESRSTRGKAHSGTRAA